MAQTQTLRRLVPILVLLILVFAAGLRFYKLNWDGGIFAHPDERSTVAFYAPTIKWPENSEDILNPRTSRLNPFWNVDSQERRSYTYGHFPLYTLVLAANFLSDLTPLAVEYNLPAGWIQFLSTSQSGHGYALTGRFLVALADLFSVLLLFLIGKRLYGVWGGLLAAAFATFTVLQIQLAHFFAVDPISTTFVLLALYGSMRLYDKQSIASAILTGIAVALAVASKFSALPIVFAPILAAILVVIRKPETGLNKSQLRTKMIGLILLALGVAFLLFAVTSPFVLLDFENFKRAVLDEQGNMVSGVADFPFTRQYRGTTAYLYFIDQQIRWGMGWALGLLGLAGTIWVLIKAIRGKAEVGELIALAWIVLYFGPTGLFLAKFMRYMSPIVPLVSLFGAGLIVALWHWKPKPKTEVQSWANSELADVEPPTETTPPPEPKTTRTTAQKVARITAVALATIVLLSSAVWSLAFVNGVYRNDHPWITFSRWMYANVPDGSCIAYEHWDDRLPSDLPEPGGRAYEHQYYQPQLPMYDDDTEGKYLVLRDTLMECDYVVLATNRLWRTIPKLPERYPMSVKFYDALFSGQLGFERVHVEETPPTLGPLVIDDQPADESFTVYDHPKPQLFKKTRQLSAEEWDALLGNTWQDAVLGDVGSPTLMMRLRGGGQSGYTPPATQQPENINTLLDTPVDQLPTVDDYRWNSIANNNTLAAIIIWWLVIIIIGVGFFPLTFMLFNKLPDRGYALSKSLGLLLLTYLVWIASSLVGTRWLGNTLPTIFIALFILLAINVLIVFKQRRAIAQFLRQQSWLLLSIEVVFTVAYLLFVFLRILNPDLWHPWLGGEKMLEIGFLNAIVKSTQMPPYDPFFAGTIINYYYYGLFLVGVLIKLTGIQPSIAFNLAIPTLAALTAINAFSLAGNATVIKKLSGVKYITAGLLAILFIAFMGNMEGAAQFMRNLAALSQSSFESAIPGVETLVRAGGGFIKIFSGDAPATYNYWDPTRVIPETINEFPFFSFLFADLHPHMIGIPFTLLFLSLAFQWLLPEAVNERINESANQRIGEEAETQENETIHTKNHSQFAISNSPFAIRNLLRGLAIPFVLGALAVINTWDLPTYLGLIVAAFLLAQYRKTEGDLSLKRVVLILVSGLVFAGVVLGVTYLLYLPFFANYKTPAETGVGLVHTQTPLDLHLKIWSFFLFVIVSWLWISLLHPGSRNSVLRAFSLFLRRWNVLPHLTEVYRRLVQQSTTLYQLGLWSVLGVVILSVLLFALGYRVPAYLLPLVALAIVLLLRREVYASTAFLNLLAFTGLSILLGVEFFFLRDFLGGGDYYRMNTLFKFFIQVWVMFGVVASVAMLMVWNWSGQWSLPGQIVWRLVAMVLLLAGLVYPIFGTRTRIDDRFPGDENRPPIGTLDGLAYMTRGSFQWPAGNSIELNYDYEAIRWLQDNVEGTPIIAEAKVGYYREGGMRVAAYTGLPSILGGLHQSEQHPASQVGRRDQPVNEFWNTPDPNRALQLMDELDISYIYVGQLERALNSEPSITKFEQLREQGTLELFYENEQVKIYRRVL